MYGPPTNKYGIQTFIHTPLKTEPMLRGTWFPKCRRSGLIGIKIGVMPQWFTDGKPFLTTLIQVASQMFTSFNKTYQKLLFDSYILIADC